MPFDDKKEKLTKEIIACRLIKKETKRMWRSMAAGLLIVLAIFIAVIGIPWLGGVYIGLIVCLVLHTTAVMGLYLYRTIPLRKMTFTVDVDRVLSKSYKDVPWYCRTDGRFETIITFYEYGYMTVSYEIKNYAQKNGEFYIVVPYPGKKKGIWCYNKDFYEYSEK